MTTISIGSAFEGMGNANNGYRSASFERFCRSLDGFRDRVEAQYAGAVYPAGTPLAGQTFNPEKGTINKYSADVMIPAFLATYTSMGGKSLDIFPTLTHLLPNWTVRYSGLGKLPWFRDHFKSVNLNHAYKSVYAVGAYSSYSTYHGIHGRTGIHHRCHHGQPHTQLHVQRLYGQHQRVVLAPARHRRDVPEQPHLQARVQDHPRAQPLHDQRPDQRGHQQRLGHRHGLQDQRLQTLRRWQPPQGEEGKKKATATRTTTTNQPANQNAKQGQERRSTTTSTCGST